MTVHLPNICIALSLGAAACAPTTPRDAAPRGSLQTRALDKLVAQTQGWRLATKVDISDSTLIRYSATNPAFEPYRLWTDATGDRKPDLIVALVPVGASNRPFRVYALASFKDGLCSPQLLETTELLAEALWPESVGFAIGPVDPGTDRHPSRRQFYWYEESSGSIKAGEFSPFEPASVNAGSAPTAFRCQLYAI